jgi:HlyD family secretion protein
MDLPLLNNVKKPVPLIAGIVAATIGVVGVGTVAVNSFKPAPKIDLDRYTIPVKSETIKLRTSTSGTILPVQTVNLSPKVSGRISQLFVEQGDRVQKGQRIAQMENTEQQAEYDRALANLKAAQANLNKAKNGTRPEEIAQAEAKLAQARANLAKVQNGSRPEEIAQIRAKLAQAQASLKLARSTAPQQIEQAQAQVAAAQAKLNLAKTQVDRNRSLRNQGAVSQDALDRANADYQTARASLLDAQQKLLQVKNSTQQDIVRQNAIVFEAQQSLQQAQLGSRSEDIANAQAQVKQAEFALHQAKNGSRPEDIAQLTAAVEVAQAQLRSAQSQLRDTLVIAPFAGSITQRYADEGAFVTPTTSASSSTSATSTSIVALAKDLEVKAKVPEVDIGKIRPTQKVEIVADAYADRTFQGTVRLVAPEAVVEQNVTSFEVRVQIDTGKDVLRSGMNVNVNFAGGQINNALTIPTVAIASKKGQSGVYITDSNNEPTFKPIKIGSAIRDRTQVLEGLQSSDRVFIDIPKGFKDKMMKEEK